MSRALGAAFLNHQVEQLEKSVVNRGPSSGNWRDRDRRAPQNKTNADPARGKRVQATVLVAPANTKSPKKRMDDKPPVAIKKRVAEDTKDADVVIVDASVLIHDLTQLKKWCRADRKETIVIPLEGTSMVVCSRYITDNPYQHSTPSIF